jgi:hypothetical protein
MESKCIGVLWSVVVNTNLDAAPLSLDIQMASRRQSSMVLLDIVAVICFILLDQILYMAVHDRRKAVSIINYQLRRIIPSWFNTLES